jgi:acyl-CoA synthetase (AMP-forming)/AMP-acid ligase II
MIERRVHDVVIRSLDTDRYPLIVPHDEENPIQSNITTGPEVKFNIEGSYHRPMNLRTEHDDRPLRDLTLNRALENRARRIGSKPFVMYGPEDRSVTYEEMNRMANTIGNSLIDLGVEKGEAVSVFLRDPLRTLFAKFGIQKAGAVYVPINFEYEGEVLQYQLEDTAPNVLFVEDRYIKRLNALVGELERLPALTLSETDEDAVDPAPAYDVTTLASMLAPRSPKSTT